MQKVNLFETLLIEKFSADKRINHIDSSHLILDYIEKLLLSRTTRHYSPKQSFENNVNDEILSYMHAKLCNPE